MKLLSFVIGFSCLAFALAENNTAIPSIDIMGTGSPDKPTTTTGPVTTSPSGTTTPAPFVDVPTNDYNYTSNGTICLKARFGAQFIHEKKFWNVSRDAQVDDSRSNCSRLAVKFEHGSFIIIFGMTSQSAYYMHEVEATLKKPSLDATAENLTLAKATNGSSFLCKSGLKIEMSNNVTFKMTEVTLQPYYVKDGTFGTAQNCENDLSPIVPIIVGAVLAGLVVIVIIAYFVGRSRNRAGYDEI